MIVNLSRLGKSGTGMWQYSINFINALRTKVNIEAVICGQIHADFFSRLGFNVITVPDIVSNTSKTSRIRPLLWYVYSYWLALKILFKYRYSKVVCTTHHMIPLIKNQTITVHDVRPFYFPDSIIQSIYFKILLKRSINSCRHILTVSHTVKNKISEIYDVELNKISVIYNCINSTEFVKEDVKDNYFLAVGASWAHKNIHSFINNHRLWSGDYDLLIVCGRTKYAEYLKVLVDDQGLEGKVRFVHEVSFSELKELYAKAYALIYPSLDEGFGIPPIEAMASNTPVIVSDIPVFHEVLLDSVLYVNPGDPESWKVALDKLMNLSSDNTRFDKYVERFNFEHMEKMIECWLVESAK